MQEELCKKDGVARIKVLAFEAGGRTGEEVALALDRTFRYLRTIDMVVNCSSFSWNPSELEDIPTELKEKNDEKVMKDIFNQTSTRLLLLASTINHIESVYASNDMILTHFINVTSYQHQLTPYLAAEAGYADYLVSSMCKKIKTLKSMKIVLTTRDSHTRLGAAVKLVGKKHTIYL
jgi:hypothetical protein